jgi:N-acetylmuramoyl-L-alanine amidase
MASLSLAAVLSAAAVVVAYGQAADQTEAKPAASCQRADFRVVLDVGHTAEAPGAKSARGLDEYDFNLRLARLIDKALLDAGFAKTVLMVTGGGAVRSMYVRVAHANSLSANLLLSIHHDSVPDKMMEKWEYNGKREIYNDQFKGHSIFVSDDNVDHQQSLMFASMLGEQLKARGLQYTPHYTEKFMGHNRHPLLDAIAGVYRYDTLFVLKKANMPAALLEAGSIVNRDEELALETPERQQLIGAAVVAAVDGFCAAQAGKPVTREAHRAAKIRHVLSAHSRRRPRERTATTAQVTTVSQSNFDMH